MVVAPTDAETLERALHASPSRFALSNGRAGHEVVTDEPAAAGLGDDGEPCCGHSGLPARGPGRPAVSGPGTDCGLRCMSGAMANGIGSVEIVEAMGRARHPGGLRLGRSVARRRSSTPSTASSEAWATRFRSA